jgi:23S rRNA (cytidine1920-2'-O)/16S rRNA (cytidine1409-2'-O)-methyltransferase
MDENAANRSPQSSEEPSASAEVSARQRLDLALVQRGLVESRARAQALILAGEVRVDDEVERRAGRQVQPATAIEVVRPARFVSRGGEKLDHALTTFGVVPAGLICLDVGASTGGFTDCLLQHGATRVYAVDVGYGQLHWTLRQDPRVVLMERTNVRYLAQLPEPIDLATIDVSFIGLELVLPVVRRLTRAEALVVALIKPQFEAGRDHVGRGGVVRDSAIHRQVLERVVASAVVSGFALGGLTPSPLRGPAGNVEFLALLRAPNDMSSPTPLIDACLAAVRSL